jgi:hypothetical protein
VRVGRQRTPSRLLKVFKLVDFARRHEDVEGRWRRRRNGEPVDDGGRAEHGCRQLGQANHCVLALLELVGLKRDLAGVYCLSIHFGEVPNKNAAQKSGLRRVNV